MTSPKFGFYVLALLSFSLPARADAPAALDFNVAQQSVPQRVPALNFNVPTAQGTQINLNGVTISGNWMQWQGNRVGISDAIIRSQFGAELLSTTDATRQPVQWFSEAVLPTRLTPPLRYLDVTDLAQKYGWQLQISGNILQISTPKANLTAIQQEQLAGNVDRITISLDRPITWQADPQSNELVLTFDAQADQNRIQAFKPMPSFRLRSLKVEPTPNRTVVRFGIPIGFRPRITTLSNPDRIVIDIGSNFLSDRDILWTNGLLWRQRSLTVRSNQFPIVWFEVNPRQPGLSIRPILPNATTLTGTLPLFTTAQQSLTSAAINGGYFNRNNQLPLGAIKVNQRFASGPILNRGVVGWDAAGNWKFDRLRLQETLILSSGQSFPLTALNSAYVQAGIARYTADWGSTYTTLTDNEILLTVQNNQAGTQQTAEKAGTVIPLPTTGYLLVFRSNRTAAASFPPATPIQLESIFTPSDLAAFPNLIGGGPLLIRDGQIVLDARLEQFSDAFIRETAARSAIGQTSDGRILIVTAQNNVAGLGATLSDMADIMQQLGAVNALNLDGGSSTTLYLGGQLLDRPPRTSARVHNGIGVFIQP
ncbi:MAG: phosphodiester glycosidase family protein [Leptolyngbya sp. UWPOB_LEPTO1]|uniref:phosphodiester glycosidase family protein n=1 Tax=Leptolyngbya sp. UWPOB_LEPTO1 TaxID=2815653 RepID=UPI001AD3A940|nr:phosphodiester glycosidase family protein [Leptolyngbya sp. UWPOB_LEPTO1]MBN8562620.1 phosphodiester glycosidase family protein [Leptolyngbya sp. UWPOB_LEPTO1]